MSAILPTLNANGQKLIERLLTLPQGYLSADAEDGEIRRTVELAQGDVVDFGTVTMCQSASISGAVRIDDDGDGVIAATPTGSTAYSLSAGGPVVAPTCACLVISPLAPHNLTMRPVVIPDTAVITLHVHTRRSDAFVTLDNRVYAVGQEATFTVKRAEQKIFLAVPHNISFYDTLRNKMMWGIDIRS